MSGALTWGLAELLEVELADEPAFQFHYGDNLSNTSATQDSRGAAAGGTAAASVTLGWVYLATGVGALLGPLVANRLKSRGGAQRANLLRMVAGFAIGLLAYLILVAALRMPDSNSRGSVAGLLLLGLAGFGRAVSSSLVWVYSTLAVQVEVLGEGAEGNPWANPVFGRVFALEMAVFTVGKMSSFVIGGAGIGLFTCDVKCGVSVLAGIGAVSFVFWAVVLGGVVVRRSQDSRGHDLRRRLDASIDNGFN
eukprot:SAG31_NODE_7759_length_1602_cov_1.550898_2_plen_251_part_00